MLQGSHGPQACLSKDSWKRPGIYTGTLIPCCSTPPTYKRLIGKRFIGIKSGGLMEQSRMWMREGLHYTRRDSPWAEITDSENRPSAKGFSVRAGQDSGYESRGKETENDCI